ANECREPALQNTLYQQRFMQQVWADTLGYAGCELIRRAVGMAHVDDLECITDTSLRVKCEAKAIQIGRELILQRHSLASVSQLIALINYQ
ncbi:MAG: S-methyl-5-thioribose kinase, partial [Gammaproteobacteria bacterium]|nr:S-methyl-5-thioribose kinase [Gammaproteobacteria bacterium]